MTKKKKNKKNRKNFVAIPFTTLITLGTLANNTVIIADVLNADLVEDLFVISIDALWTLLNQTAGESPIEVGFAHTDYSVAEILEHLDVAITGPDSDMIEMERLKRIVRRAGLFSEQVTGDFSLNDGTKIRTPFKRFLGNNISAWARNQFGSSLTTGSVIRLSGTIFGRWVR